MRSTVWALIAVVGLTVLLSTLGASVGRTTANEGPHFTDQFHFVHQPLAGDGAVVARVLTQQDSHEWAKAGIMIKAGTTSGSPYAAIMVTPLHGVRLQGNFDTELTGSESTAPRWLKLTRSGAAITGYESSDGTTWSQVGTVSVGALPRTAEAGLFVTSPPDVHITEKTGSTISDLVATVGMATFDNVSVRPAGPLRPARWHDEDVRPAPGTAKPPAAGGVPAGHVAESAGTFTVTGSGDVGGSESEASSQETTTWS
jgi:hypothetical protein